MGILIALVAACTGRGGGQLPPTSPAFTGPASFGFSFSCESGKLKIELSYNEHGTSPLLGAPFSIHGIVDQVDPVVESATCIDHDPPPGGNELIFLGRYYLTSSPPAGFPASCPTQATDTNSLCRFEVIVQDNDRSLAPSPGDFFSIKLSTVTEFYSCPNPDPALPCVITEFDPTTVFYARAGYLDSGNITVD
jgi:hypothetical protein